MSPTGGPSHRRERLTVQKNEPPVLAVTSLTRTNAVATVVTAAPHEYLTGDYVTIAGATPTGYNGKYKITVTGPTSFTYPTNSTFTTPATGPITATYVSDAQGGMEQGWTTYRAIWAQLIPVSFAERLQAQAVQSTIDYRFRVNTIDAAGVTAAMRALWTPQWPITAQIEHTLEIRGVLPEGDGHQWTVIEAAERR
jgi:head-tail adaptor